MDEERLCFAFFVRPFLVEWARAHLRSLCCWTCGREGGVCMGVCGVCGVCGGWVGEERRTNVCEGGTVAFIPTKASSSFFSSHPPTPAHPHRSTEEAVFVFSLSRCRVRGCV